MQVKCPACHASFSLEAALAIDAGRSAMMQALAMPAPLARLLAAYLGMFRSAARAINFDRVEKLLVELHPMLDRQQVTRNGSTRAAPLAVWQAGFERMVELRDAGKLDLPLKTHGYLLEIVFSLADKVEAKAERDVEQQRQRGEHRNAPVKAEVERAWQISHIRADLGLGLITREQAVEKLAAAGIKPEALNG